MLELFTKLCLTFLFTGLLIKALKPLARKVGLLDMPGGRKQHTDATPIIGGIALYGTILISSAVWGKADVELYCYLISAGIMVATGAMDDRFDLPVRWRVLLETAAALIMIFGANVVVTNLGNLFGFGEVTMPMWMAVPFTVIATFGVINCLNMIDGLDGLASGLSLITVIGFLVVIGDTGSSLVPIIALIAGLMAFLVFNLRLYPKLKKVFLGDAGSMLLGFTLVWIMVRSTQGAPDRAPFFAPVTALYLIGLPLFDMVRTVLRRAAKGKNPFAPDRTHIHHLLLNSGFSITKSLIIILSAQLMINSVGILLWLFEIQSFYQFYLFFGCFCVYHLFIKEAFSPGVIIEKNRMEAERIIKASIVICDEEKSTAE